jgi:hypothetical protein
MEPAVVLVYKIETNDYLTVSRFLDGGNFETYELNHPEEFNTFSHVEGQPLIGRGYFMQQKDTYNMTKFINKQIQKHRVIDDGPIHIVSTESAAGTIRYSLDRPRKVLAFSDFFSYGPLWKLEMEEGQAYRNEWLFDNINLEFHDDYENEMRFANTLLEIEDIREGVPIYIWVGNNTHEQIGVRFILQLLSGKANVVSLINSTALYQKFINHQLPIYHTSQMTPDHIKLIFEQGKNSHPLSLTDRAHYVREWESLAQSRGVLRLWGNNEIISVSENHYDSLIIQIIKKIHREQAHKDFIRASKVIGEMLEQMMEEWVSDSFLEYRIRYLIYNGILELKGVPKSMRHYSVKLR